MWLALQLFQYFIDSLRCGVPSWCVVHGRYVFRRVRNALRRPFVRKAVGEEHGVRLWHGGAFPKGPACR